MNAPVAGAVAEARKEIAEDALVRSWRMRRVTLEEVCSGVPLAFAGLILRWEGTAPRSTGTTAQVC